MGQLYCSPRLEEWNYSSILQGEGSRYDCGNYRGITLLSVPGKVYARVILSRIRGHLQQLRRKEQSGFTPHRSTTDRIATLRMIIQTRREFRRPTWVAYVDFRAAFDSVNRQSLWLLLKTKGVPQKLINLIEDLSESTVKAQIGFRYLPGCAKVVLLLQTFFGTNRLDNQSLRSPRLRRCEPGSGSVHRS